MGQRFLICAYFSPDSDFFTGESNIIVRWLWFEVKNVLMLDLFLTNTVNTQLLTSLDINWWLEWCGLLWCFISGLTSHSDGTHSLQRIHCRASDVVLHFSKSVPMKKQTTFTTLKTWGWLHFQNTLIFNSLAFLLQSFVMGRVTNSLNCCLCRIFQNDYLWVFCMCCVLSVRCWPG